MTNSDKLIFDAIEGYITANFSANEVTLEKPSEEFTICHQESFEADCVIIDKYLGSIGVVAIYQANDQSVTLKQWLLNQLDNANYMQHLILQEEQQRQDSRKIWQVELVLLVAEDMLQPLQRALQTQALNYNYLYNIGVNCAAFNTESNPLPDKQLASALRWLLPKSRKLLSSKASKAQHQVAVTLNNYRLPEQRSLTFSKDNCYHMVHGQNGSGKSTFVEALEWLKTGSIHRLKSKHIEAVNYLPIVKNRDAQQQQETAFSVQFSLAGKTKAKLCEDHGSISFTPKGSQPCHRLNFLIDQQLMDQLTQQSPAERAALLVEGFFPDSESIIAELQTAKDKQAATKANFDKEKQNFEETFTADQQPALIPLLDAEDYQIETLVQYGVIPFNAEQISRLRYYFAGVPEWMQPARGSIEDISKWLNQLEASLPSNSTELLQKKLSMIQASLTSLELISPYQADRLILEGSFAQALNGWLEEQSLAQMLTQQLRIARTLDSATKQDWQARPGDLASGINYNDEALKTLQQQLSQLKVSERYQQLMSHIENPEASAQHTTDNTAVRYQLTYEQTDQLNQLDKEFSLLDTDADKPDGIFSNQLGNRISNALKKNVFDNLILNLASLSSASEDSQIISINFGQPDAVAPLIDWLQQQQQALRSLLETLPKENNKQISHRWQVLQAYGKAKRSHTDQAEIVKKLAKKVETAFLKKIKAMQTPLNELMSLFTPARWAYEDLHIGGDESAIALNLGQQGADSNKHEHQHKQNIGAELIFNTAELNLFTLALFLLGAKPDPKFGGLLIWDDPLQNMDELTVTTLARGLARLQPLLQQRGVKLVMFFHGADDLARFRNVVHGETIKLPWIFSMTASATAASPKTAALNNQSKTADDTATKASEDTEAIVEKSLFIDQWPPIKEIFTPGESHSETTD